MSLPSCDKDWPKECGYCGAHFTVDEWERLTYVGLTKASEFGFDGDLEHRLCSQCGNDLAQTCVRTSDIIKVA